MAAITRLIAAFFMFLPLLSGHAATADEKRYALVIGNNKYPRFDASVQLEKAVNDSQAVGDALEHDGFDVIRGANLSRAEMVDKLSDLSSRIQPGDVAFFYFSGHGISLSGGNYLLPSDVPSDGSESRIANQSIAEADIIADLQRAGARVTIVVLDACRNNPFRRPGVRDIGREGGLAHGYEGTGVFSLYSAGFGQTALEELSRADPNPNSVFTRVLAPLLTKPGLSLDDLAADVRDEVSRLAASTPDHHVQIPASYNQVAGGRLYLAGAPPVSTPSASEDQITWSIIQTSSDPKLFESFIGRFPQSPLRAEAEVKLLALTRGGGPTEATRLASLPRGENAGQPLDLAKLVRACDLVAASVDAGVGTAPSIYIKGAIQTCEAALAADAKNPHLLYQMGRVLEAAKDEGKARGFYEKAADQSDAGAQRKLGNFFKEGRGGLAKDDHQATRLYKLAADQGDAFAQFHLGLFSATGRGGLAKDDREAARLYKLSADQGNSFGQNSLGFIYERGGGGLPQDQNEALRLYKLSADQGNSFGQNNLGRFYENGLGGLPKNAGEAARLYKLSADQSNADGQFNLGRFHEDGLGGLAKDDREAARLYKLSADQGNSSGENSLGFMYERGSGGLSQNYNEAARLYKLSADQNNPYGQNNVARFYENGFGGVPLDEREAARLYKLSADRGNVWGQANLARFYENGRGGLSRDVLEAARLYKLSADQGNAVAAAALARVTH